jgi:autotransporter-associated beta strand protein
LGNTSGADSATLAIGSAGVTLNNPIDVRSGSSGTMTIAAQNTTGTATFSGTIAANRNVDLNAASGGTLALSGNISGTSTIAKRGAGTAVLSGNNATGLKYDLFEGELQAAAADDLGDKSGGFLSNKFYFDGGTLGATGTFTLGGDNGVTLGGGGGTIRVSSGQTLTLQAYMADLDLTNLFKKTGGGTLTLNKTGANDFSHTTLVIEEGTLSTWNPELLSSTVQLGGAASSGTFSFTKTDGGVSTAKNFSLNAGGGTISVTDNALTVTGTISGTGGLTKTGAGTLTVSGNNTFDGNVAINGGKLTMSNGNALGDTGTIAVNAGADLEVTGGITVARNLTLSAKDGVIRGGRLMSSGASKNTYSGTVAVNNSEFDVASGSTLDVTGKISGTGTVTKTGAGELQLSNTGNDYSGITDVQNGTLTASTIANSSTASTIGSGSELKVGSASTAGTFKYTGGSASMNRTVTVGTAGGTINVNDSAATMTLSGTVAGSGATMTKTGAGKLALGNGSSTTVSTIAIQQGTLLLGASNQIDNNTAITLSGGTLDTAGYADAVGKLTVSANSTIQGLNSTSGSAFTFSDIDLGNYSTSGGSTLTFLNSSGTSYGLGTVIQLSSVAASSWSGYSATSLNNFSSKISFSDANLMAQINFGGGTSGTTLTVAAIPEPKVYFAAAGLVLLIGMAEYRRRRQRA